MLKNNYFRKSTRSNVRAVFQLEGYELENKTIHVPLKTAEVTVYMKTAEEMDEIIITSTRGTRTISNIPTRVEFMLVRNWRKSEYEAETLYDA
jgi:hypothetical protein